MGWDTIRKAQAERASATMPDPDALRARFTWADARASLDGLPDGGLNIAHEALDRHVAAGHGGQVAIRWLGRNGARRDLTYADLAGLAARFASALSARGLKRGDRVYALMGRTPELYAAALGALKAGMTFTPLFAAFGPEPIRARMEIGSAAALVTTGALSPEGRESARIAGLAAHRAVTGDEAPEGCVALAPALAEADPALRDSATRPRPGSDPLHLGHDGPPQRRGSCPRGRRLPCCDGALRARSAAGRHLLVHGRSRLGDRHVLRDHRASG
jgi:acetyl-CoA synthetase